MWVALWRCCRLCYGWVGWRMYERTFFIPNVCGRVSILTSFFLQRPRTLSTAVFAAFGWSLPLGAMMVYPVWGVPSNLSKISNASLCSGSVVEVGLLVPGSCC